MPNFSLDDAKQIGENIGIDWEKVDFSPESFLKGLEVELEHGTKVSEETNVTDDDPSMTGQIAWVHLIESPDYYEGLAKMEKELKDKGGEKGGDSEESKETVVSAAYFSGGSSIAEKAQELLREDPSFYNATRKQLKQIRQVLREYTQIDLKDLDDRDVETIDTLNLVQEKLSELMTILTNADEMYGMWEEEDAEDESFSHSSRKSSFILHQGCVYIPLK